MQAMCHIGNVLWEVWFELRPFGGYVMECDGENVKLLIISISLLSRFEALGLGR